MFSLGLLRAGGRTAEAPGAGAGGAWSPEHRSTQHRAPRTALCAVPITIIILLSIILFIT